MEESDLIYDWNIVDYEFKRDASNHPHEIWFDDETLRDGLQSPSARNPTIEQKIELLSYMERLGVCLLYTSPSPRDQRGSRMPSSA